MKGSVKAVLVSVVLVASQGLAPAHAGGLLSGLGETVGSVVDTVTDTVDSVISLNDDDNDALVNLDVGGDSLVNAAVGKGDSPLVNANVSSTGMLQRTAVSLDVAGLGVDVDLGLAPADPANPGDPNDPRGRVLVGSVGGAEPFVIKCTVNNTRQLLQVAAAGKITEAEFKAWQQSANVQIVPIPLCPTARKQVAEIMVRSQKISQLQRAVTADTLITASLSRTRYDATDVVAVQRNNGQLVVYVY